jgi:hypothetical protein
VWDLEGTSFQDIDTDSHHPSRLVAILLGHLWMNVNEAMDALQSVGVAIFPENSDSEPDKETRTKRLTESVESILRTRGVPLDRKMQDTGEESIGCKVYV